MYDVWEEEVEEMKTRFIPHPSKHLTQVKCVKGL